MPLGAIEGGFASTGHRWPSLPQISRRRNFQRPSSFALQMELENDDSRAADFDAMDRRVIQIDLPPAHAGITAALRRAFEAAAAEPCDRDFEELLRRLN